MSNNHYDPKAFTVQHIKDDSIPSDVVAIVDSKVRVRAFLYTQGSGLTYYSFKLTPREDIVVSVNVSHSTNITCRYEKLKTKKEVIYEYMTNIVLGKIAIQSPSVFRNNYGTLVFLNSDLVVPIVDFYESFGRVPEEEELEGLLKVSASYEPALSKALQDITVSKAFFEEDQKSRYKYNTRMLNYVIGTANYTSSITTLNTGSGLLGAEYTRSVTSNTSNSVIVHLPDNVTKTIGTESTSSYGYSEGLSGDHRHYNVELYGESRRTSTNITPIVEAYENVLTHLDYSAYGGTPPHENCSLHNDVCLFLKDTYTENSYYKRYKRPYNIWGDGSGSSSIIFNGHNILTGYKTMYYYGIGGAEGDVSLPGISCQNAGFDHSQAYGTIGLPGGGYGSAYYRYKNETNMLVSGGMWGALAYGVVDDAPDQTEVLSALLITTRDVESQGLANSNWGCCDDDDWVPTTGGAWGYCKELTYVPSIPNMPASDWKNWSGTKSETIYTYRLIIDGVSKEIASGEFKTLGPWNAQYNKVANGTYILQDTLDKRDYCMLQDLYGGLPYATCAYYYRDTPKIKYYDTRESYFGDYFSRVLTYTYIVVNAEEDYASGFNYLGSDTIKEIVVGFKMYSNKLTKYNPMPDHVEWEESYKPFEDTAPSVSHEVLEGTGGRIKKHPTHTFLFIVTASNPVFVSSYTNYVVDDDGLDLDNGGINLKISPIEGAESYNIYCLNLDNDGNLNQENILKLLATIPHVDGQEHMIYHTKELYPNLLSGYATQLYTGFMLTAGNTDQIKILGKASELLHMSTEVTERRK